MRCVVWKYDCDSRWLGERVMVVGPSWVNMVLEWMRSFQVIAVAQQSRNVLESS